MAFETITGKLQNIFKNLANRGKLSEKEVRDAMREIKLALLEADVNFLVVKDFIKRTTELAVGESVLESLTPGQQVIKIVRDELTKLMGESNSRISFGSVTPAVILVCGLQGAGKTTFCAKLADHLNRQFHKKVMLAACDVCRPAAIEQLKVLGAKVGVPVYDRGMEDPVETATLAIERARRDFLDVVVIDTAGRLHIDEEMMQQLSDIRDAVRPAEILLAVDAMTGQDAVNVAEAFNNRIGVTGIVLTKLDGDARGGAALSVRAVTGKPIKLVSTGEKIGDLEPFYPDRMASRILGMGDVLSLIEKAEQAFDQQKSMELAQKIKKDAFTLDDFLDQLEQMKNMGSMQDILKMIPGGNQLSNVTIDEKALSHTQAIIQSMTRAERANPDILNASRRKRIAKGCGLTVQDVNRLMNQYANMRKMMKQFSGGKLKKGRFGRMPFGF